MADANSAVLRTQLKAAPHGGVELHVLRALAKLGSQGDRKALEVLVEHAVHGRGVHRGQAALMLAELSGAVRTKVSPSPMSDFPWAKVFVQLVAVADVSDVPFWAVPGLLHAAGAKGYSAVLGIARNQELPVDLRAQAIKSLARASRQLFDRELPADPGQWKKDQIRMKEVNDWAASGFPDGPGHSFPPRDRALDNPSTPLEHLAARLEKRLAKEREKAFWPEDPAELRLRLVAASRGDLDAIRALWTLPSIYLEFLTRFSPLRVRVESQEFFNDGLHLYGASELIQRQIGHAWYPDSQHPHPEWPRAYVVIADHALDPYVIDLQHATSLDAPVLTAEHGTGSWDFHQVACSFMGFLEHVIESK